MFHQTMFHQTTTSLKSGALVLLTLLGLASVAQAESPVPVEPQPAWVLDVPASRNAEVPLAITSSGVHYLLVDSQVRASDDKPPEHFFHYAERVLNQTGVEGSSQITIDFDPTYESLTLHELVIWRDGRAIDKLNTARMSLIHREGELNNLLYNGHQTLHVILDDVRTGDIIEYRFTLEGDNPIYNGIFAYSHSLNWSVPVHRLGAPEPMKQNIEKYEMTLDKGWPSPLHMIHWMLTNLPGRYLLIRSGQLADARKICSGSKMHLPTYL